MTVERSSVPAEFLHVDQPSEKQVAFIKDLLSKRQVDDDVKSAIEGYLERGEYSRSDASKAIERLLTLPQNNSQFVRNLGEMPKVPDSRYAIEHPDVTEGVLKFYRVKTGKGERWEGFIFLDAGRGGAHGDLQWTAIKDVAYKKAVLGIIAQDPRAAGLRFGREVGACCRCGRSLTQEHTRAAGIGDECASKGW